MAGRSGARRTRSGRTCCTPIRPCSARSPQDGWRARGLPLLYEIRAFWEDAAVGNGTGVEVSWRYRATRAVETAVAKRAGAVAVICEGLRGTPALTAALGLEGPR